MKNIRFIITAMLFCGFYTAISQEIPTNRVLNITEISSFLNADVKAELSKNGAIYNDNLADYFKEKYAERYFYNWKNFNNRFEEYKTVYPEKKASHTERALDHISKFSDSTQWILPFNYLNGEPVNAYALRHLARQHKMIDIAFYYNYKNKDVQYLSYFKNQLKSLNIALEANKYERIEGGNGVFEAFRAGYRVLNWLQIHAMFLGEESYSNEDQLTTIATLLQHGASLYKENATFNPGNHQTRGMSALAMISILLRDFKGTAIWYKHSMKLLEEHLSKEINDDGFQFERSIHYHKSDIENYYFVYQLAKISNIKVSDFWENKLKSLFTTLTKVSYPDKSAPVLQDDTDNPWAEKNEISDALTLGYLLFEDPEMGYFATTNVAAKMYWYLSDKQLELLKSIKKESPVFNSVSFPSTGYFIQRDGWELKNHMMIISAGVDKDKPDHQHGDILGIQAMANGKVILPNYQVRYSLPDYEFFKNSLVKNVALVDNELQGKKYGSNQGGSGFGKFGELPKPTVITNKADKTIDIFVGSHDGFNNVGVNYTRQVVNIKNNFWIVKDNFKSKTKHTYKQVWQGHYSLENKPNLIRTTFDDATGNDIFQLVNVDEVTTSGARGKQWSIVSKEDADNFSFITVIYPYSGFDNRIDETYKSPSLKGWQLNNSKWTIEGNGVISLSKENKLFVFSAKKITLGNLSIESSMAGDFYIELKDGFFTLQSVGDTEIELTILGVKNCTLNNVRVNNKFKISPSNQVVCELH